VAVPTREVVCTPGKERTAEQKKKRKEEGGVGGEEREARGGREEAEWRRAGRDRYIGRNGLRTSVE
jgi:hypothetical protein